MNNARFIEESEKPTDSKVLLRQRHTVLLKVIEALQELSNNEQWLVLKECVFDEMVGNLEKRLKIESQKDELNAPEIYRINGKLTVAKKYSDLYKLSEAYKQELNNITKKLNENGTF